MTCVDTSVTPNTVLSKIVFYGFVYEPFAIERTSAGQYHNNMVCTLDWQVSSSFRTSVEFTLCQFFNPAECKDKAMVTLSGNSETQYCGASPIGIATGLDNMHIDFTTDGSGAGVGCSGYLLSYEGKIRSI